MEKHDAAAHKALPTEIKVQLVNECLKNSAKDVASLLCTDKSFYEVANAAAWRSIYYKLYKNHDEFDVDKPSHEIKLFLRYFLPSNPNPSNKVWLKALISRTIYDNHLLAANIDKTEKDRSGWRTVVSKEKSHPRNFHYKRNLTHLIYAYGFDYNFEPVMKILEDVDIKFHLCFLELTIQRFFADPTDYPISAIDAYHFTKQVNVHIMYSKFLCSKPIPDPLPKPTEVASERPMFNNYNGVEPIFLNGDNVEYTIQPGREWGVYSNYACQGLLWGRDLDELLKNKYKVDISLYDVDLFAPNAAITNFSHLVQ